MSTDHPSTYADAGPQTGPRTGPRRLARTSDDKRVAGVCGGVARYLNVDATVIRVLTVVGLVLGFPFSWIFYVVLWALMPQE